MVSLWTYLSSEATRGYVLEADEERYTTRREKMYTFMKIPRELEKFMSYGFFHCLDSFLFVFTFLPIRCDWRLVIEHKIFWTNWTCISCRRPLEKGLIGHIFHFRFILAASAFVVRGPLVTLGWVYIIVMTDQLKFRVYLVLKCLESWKLNKRYTHLKCEKKIIEIENLLLFTYFDIPWKRIIPFLLKRMMTPCRGRWLYPAEIIDLLKGLIIVVCVYMMTYIDTSMMYHLIKSQSVIKLYLFYNMLEVGTIILLK